MANKHLSTKSQHVGRNPSWWYYEEPRGLCVCVPCSDKTHIVYIPWARVRSALKRKDKKVRRD